MINLSCISGLAILGSVLVPLSAAAQSSASGGNSQQARERGAEPICQIEMLPSEERSLSGEVISTGGGTVAATCEGRGYMLGRANGFVTMPHRESGAVAVVMGRESDSRVWLFSRDEDGRIVAEDLSYEFARAVGRSATSDLADVRVNLARFRETGVIGAEPMNEVPEGMDTPRGSSRAAMAPGRQGARPARAAEISLERRITRGRPANAGGANQVEGAE